MKKIVITGECMIELSGPSQAARVGYGGDSLNSAVYAARLSGPGVSVSYVTRLGTDTYSRKMRRAWEAERVDTSFVSMVEGRTAGLYAIATDEDGERSFTYWRNASPARDLFQGQNTETELAVLEKADLLYVTGISLAVLSTTGRSNLLYAMHAAKSRGAMVGFDPNYRPTLWESSENAASTIGDAYAAATLVFASDSEQREIFGDQTREATAQRLRDAGVDEWVLREGSGPITLGGRGEQSDLVVNPVQQPVDTTGAGDAFNGSYLARRAAGDTPRQAAEMAARVSAIVIQNQGAIIEASAMNSLIAEIS